MVPATRSSWAVVSFMGNPHYVVITLQTVLTKTGGLKVHLQPKYDGGCGSSG
jgi:hypothetical protein